MVAEFPRGRKEQDLIIPGHKAELLQSTQTQGDFRVAFDNILQTQRTFFCKAGAATG